MRPRWAAAALAGVAAVTAGIVVIDGSGAGPAAGAADTRPVKAPALATVQRRDLLVREKLDGTLGFAKPTAVTLGGQGTITALPAVGTVVERGGRIGEVDGRPVILLLGDRPLWRTIGEGADTADGPDIRQLEENLVALRYGTAAGLGPNDRWSQATTVAVKRMQAALGVAQTGQIAPGSAVFAPSAVRVADRTAAVGAQAGSPALSVTGTERVVTLDVPASRPGLLAAGQAVEVKLPDGTVTAATVRSVGSTVKPADPGTGAKASLAVVAVLDDPKAAGGLDQAPVDVDVVSVQAKAAVAVPIEALLALAEGGFAVERADGSLVAVTLGASADGWVELRPAIGTDLGLKPGQKVVVPA